MRATGVMGTPFEQYVIGRTPMRRFGQPDEVARVVAFLASDDAGWVTGEWLSASGGFRPG